MHRQLCYTITVPVPPYDISLRLFILLQTVSPLLQLLSAPSHDEKNGRIAISLALKFTNATNDVSFS